MTADQLEVLRHPRCVAGVDSLHVVIGLREDPLEADATDVRLDEMAVRLADAARGLGEADEQFGGHATAVRAGAAQSVALDQRDPQALVRRGDGKPGGPPTAEYDEVEGLDPGIG